ncbi:MAG: ABC transporter permease [Lachnospiraceae bacterium]|nr:ABC transporter permease [Lachnospiraceae bacterium]
MKRVFLNECKMNIRTFLIWSLVVGGLGFFCITLYESMQGDMENMADAFSKMGAFSDAFGMSTLSIATIEGFFATEVGTVHGLGSAMFAAILAIGILSKEEEGHSGEFLFSLPLSRKKVLAAKGLCVFAALLGFTLVCTALYIAGFAFLGEELPVKEFALFMSGQFLMNVEIAAVCFAISALSGKNRMGLGIGIALIFYLYDIIGRVVPDLKDYIFVGPFSYANASEIFSGAEIRTAAVVIGIAVALLAAVSAFVCYERRDLAA